MSYEFLGYEVEVPFGPAPGALNGPNQDSLIERTKEILISPVGGASIGSITPPRSEGNSPYGRTYYHDPRSGKTVNSEGLPNVGIDVAEAIIDDLTAFADDHGKPLIVSISPALCDDPAKVLPKMAYRLFNAGALAVEINYGCFNKINADGRREPIMGFDLEKIEETREAILTEVGYDKNLLEKWPPYLEEQAPLLHSMAELLLKQGGVTYVSTMNTIPDTSILDIEGDPALDVPDNLGGMSGRATQTLARQQLAILRRLLPSRIGIISCSGVDTGEEVFKRVENLGATFTSGVSVYFNNEEKGFNYAHTSRRVADEFMDAKVAHHERYGLKS